jgi:hypothetical protein
MTENENTFSTQRLPLAIFLHASERLQFFGCQLVSDRDKVEFFFHDPQHLGDQAELAFENGEFVSAKALFASQTYLRRRMNNALARQDDYNYNRKFEYDAYNRR